MSPDSEFDPKAAAKKLLREGRTGALATLMAGSGDPYCSLVNVATAADGAPLLLISRLAIHTRNILADPRVSLMLDERKARRSARRRARHADGHCCASRRMPRRDGAICCASPRRRCSSDFKDFSFYQVTLQGAHLVAGFGRIVDLKPAEVLTDVADAGALIAAEPEILEHMNGDHADAVRLYATRLLGAPDGDWRCVGLRPGRSRTAEWPHGAAPALPRARARARRAAAGVEADGEEARGA